MKHKFFKIRTPGHSMDERRDQILHPQSIKPVLSLNRTQAVDMPVKHGIINFFDNTSINIKVASTTKDRKTVRSDILNQIHCYSEDRALGTPQIQPKVGIPKLDKKPAQGQGQGPSTARLINQKYTLKNVKPLKRNHSNFPNRMYLSENKSLIEQSKARFNLRQNLHKSIISKMMKKQSNTTNVQTDPPLTPRTREFIFKNHSLTYMGGDPQLCVPTPDTVGSKSVILRDQPRLKSWMNQKKIDAIQQTIKKDFGLDPNHNYDKGCFNKNSIKALSSNRNTFNEIGKSQASSERRKLNFNSAMRIGGKYNQAFVPLLHSMFKTPRNIQ